MTTETRNANGAADGRSERERLKDRVLATLAELGSLTIGDDMITFTGQRWVVPEQFATDLKGAARFLLEIEEQMGAEFMYSRSFPYRPNDGAAAFDRAMKKVFGTTGTGRTLQTFFGPVLPQFRSVVVAADGTTIQVPWGRVHLEPLEATFTVGATRTAEHGIVSQITVEAPRKHRQYIEAFFAVIEHELATASIYRGKAFTGGEEPQFLDTRDTDPSQVVYADEVLEQLRTELWSVLMYSDAMRQHGQSLKRAVLVEGPYGTGKTLAGKLTAAVAVAHGWTFLIARPGKDDLGEVLNTAKLYAPAVVWFEDIDTVADGEGDDTVSISRLLDMLDGITTKGTEVVAAFTTNFVENLHQGVLRPGRIDAVIHIGALDDEGIRKLITARIPTQLLDAEVDWAQVAAAHAGYLPAFVAESAGRAVRRSTARNGGEPSIIGTDDMLYAANSLRSQHDLMAAAAAGTRPDPLSVVLRRELRGGVDGVELRDDDDDLIGTIKEPGASKV